MSLVESLISALKVLLRGELTQELSELLKSYSIMGEKHELEYEDYVRLADALEKAAAKSLDHKQETSLKELVKLWRERARIVAHDQLFKLREEADTHISRGQLEDALACYEKAVALGEKIKDQLTAAYIANNFARAYLAKLEPDYVKAVEWFEKVIASNSEDYSALLGLSYALGNSGRLEEAVQASERATEVYENGVEGWFNRGFFLMQLDRDQEALDAFEKGIMVDRTYSPIWYAKAQLLTKMREFQQSIICYEEYLNLQPNDADAWNDKGNVYYDYLKDYERAEQCYRKTLEIDSSHKYALYNLGLIYIKRENSVQAIENFDKAIKVDSSYADAWYQKGVALELAGNFEEAVVCYRKSISLKDNLEGAWFGLGYSYYMLGRYKEALEAYDRATKLVENNERSWHNKALCLERLGKNEEAIVCYRRAIDLNPEYSKAFRSLVGLLEQLERYEEAAEYLDKLTNFESKNPDLWNWKGNIYHNYLKQYQKAVECYEQAVQSDPQYKYAWYNMGNSYRALEENDKAIQAYEKAIEADPDYFDAWYWKARVEERLKRFDESLKSYQHCVELDPKNSDAWFGIGYTQNELKNPKVAIKAYTKVLKLDKLNTAAWGNKGYSYRMLKKPKYAIKCYDKALEINPKYAYAWTEKALILMQQEGKYEEAHDALEQAIKHDSKNSTALVAMGALLFEYFDKAEEAYEYFRRASKIEPNRTDLITNIPEVLMVLGRYDEARSKAYEALKIELTPHQICVMHFIIFATLLFEHKEKEARAELQKLLQFYRTNFLREKVDWTFQGTRRFLEASASKHKHLMLRVIDLFEKKLSLTRFNEEAKRYFEFAD